MESADKLTAFISPEHLVLLGFLSTHQTSFSKSVVSGEMLNVNLRVVFCQCDSDGVSSPGSLGEL